MQSINSIETDGHGTSKDLVSYKGEVKCKNIIKREKTLTLTLTLIML